MTVVHFPATQLKTLTTIFENLYGFEFSAMSTPTFEEKKLSKRHHEKMSFFHDILSYYGPEHFPLTLVAVLFL
jgi:hypothetical protein